MNVTFYVNKLNYFALKKHYVSNFAPNYFVISNSQNKRYR